MSRFGVLDLIVILLGLAVVLLLAASDIGWQTTAALFLLLVALVSAMAGLFLLMDMRR